jgi:hypothetical protein
MELNRHAWHVLTAWRLIILAKDKLTYTAVSLDLLLYGLTTTNKAEICRYVIITVPVPETVLTMRMSVFRISCLLRYEYMFEYSRFVCKLLLWTRHTSLVCF